VIDASPTAVARRGWCLSAQAGADRFLRRSNTLKRFHQDFFRGGEQRHLIPGTHRHSQCVEALARGGRRARRDRPAAGALRSWPLSRDAARVREASGKDDPYLLNSRPSFPPSCSTSLEDTLTADQGVPERASENGVRRCRTFLAATGDDLMEAPA